MKKSPPFPVLAAVWLVAAGLIMLELILTRVFSVTMWYHFAFMAISVAMLGLSAGAVLVHRLGAGRHEDSLFAFFPVLTVSFGFLAIAGIAVVLRLKLNPTLGLGGLGQLAAIYALTSTPFILGGAALAIIVRRYGSSMSSIYFADLTGAAAGCVAVIPLLRFLGGPATVYVSALLLAAAGLVLSSGRTRWFSIAGLLLVATLLGVNNYSGLLKVVWAKQRSEKGILYDGWNSFSRITVFPTEEEWNTQFFGWGMSPVYDGPLPRQLGMHIDSYAGTPISEFSGDYEELDHLAYDVTSLAYHLRPFGTHLVIGPGGGRDILASLRMGADSVVAVEVNPQVVEAVNEVFGDFSGRPYSLPKVEAVIAEARSFLRRENRKFDVIQASLVDTWAATAAGAYTLSENTLYTVEAVEDYLARLEDQGLVSISRFLFDPPRESLRLFAVVLTALDKSEKPDPPAHVAVISCKGIATLIVRGTPFPESEIAAILDLADSLSYGIVYLPGGSGSGSGSEVFSELATNYKNKEFYRKYLFDVSPTTDDRPFFFNMVKPVDFIKVFKLNDLQGQTHSYDAVFVLVVVLAMACVMTGLLVIWPLRSFYKGTGAMGAQYVTYFVLLGLGFMLAEVTLLQKLALFLGHPVYSLSVVLLGLLLFGGLGSFATRRVPKGKEGKWVFLGGLWLALLFLIARKYLDVPLVLCLGYSKTVRVSIALALMLPAGLVMGTLLPLGIRSAAAWQKESTPWFWGVNGAASVLGSVLAFVLAMNFGFGVTFFLASLCYALAAVLFVLVSLRSGHS